ncbi:MAG: potassium channel family protein [Acidimicrobiales bacterium]
MVASSYFTDDQPRQRVRLGIASLGGVLALGTVAYWLLGLTLLDAFYQTVITVTTVGYGEIPPESGEITSTYRLVTSVLVLGGVAVGVYTLGVFFEALIEGRLKTQLGRVRMQREIDQMSDHIIICGYGQVGEAIAAAVMEHGDPIVIIDQREDLHQSINAPTVRGNATDDDALQAAGIGRARGLVTALDTDAGNLFVTISARTINPALYIVSRANEASSVAKLLAAGADRVVNPHEIGGVRMASFMLQPNVADFVGESMSDARYEVRLGETEVGEGSPLAGHSIQESGIRNDCGVIVLAIRRPDGSFVHQPAASAVPVEGDVLITIGTYKQQHALEAWIDQKRPSA